MELFKRKKAKRTKRSQEVREKKSSSLPLRSILCQTPMSDVGPSPSSVLPEQGFSKLSVQEGPLGTLQLWVKKEENLHSGDHEPKDQEGV